MNLLKIDIQTAFIMKDVVEERMDQLKLLKIEELRSFLHILKLFLDLFKAVINN